MPYKSIYSKQLNVLKKWGKEKHSLTVVFDTGQSDRYLPDERIILINDIQSDQHKYYALLHELGHHMNRTRGSMNYHKRFNLLTEAESRGKPIRSYAYRVQYVEEEMEAWRNGEKIAKQLNLKLDLDKYRTYGSKWVMTYIDWAAARDWQHHFYSDD